MKRSLLLATFRARVIPGRFLARRTFRQGLAVATAGLAFVGSTSATDLIVNGSFEADGDIKNSGGLAGGPATGWTGFLQTYTFQDLYFNGPVIPAEENPGTHYTWQHRAVQGVDGPAAVRIRVSPAVPIPMSIWSNSTWSNAPTPSPATSSPI